MCSRKRRKPVRQHQPFGSGDACRPVGVLVKAAAQFRIDGLIHPVACLLMAAALEITVLFHKVEITVNHIPHLCYAKLEIARICKHLGSPPRRWRGEKMQGRTELGLRQACTVDIVAVGFVDYDTVGHLHDAALDALQLVAGACKLDKQEEIDHRMHGGLALPHPTVSTNILS